MARRVESFENLMNKLEGIVGNMEREQLTLEESMKHYEEGIKLCNLLYKQLNEAEGKIKVLMNNKEEAFVVDEE
jgi:exodeoxyribonuclease VII small subunit